MSGNSPASDEVRAQLASIGAPATAALALCALCLLSGVAHAADLLSRPTWLTAVIQNFSVTESAFAQRGKLQPRVGVGSSRELRSAAWLVPMSVGLEYAVIDGPQVAAAAPWLLEAPRVHINPGAELSSEEYALLNAGAPFQADPFLSSIELSASNSSERKTLHMIPGLRWQMNREIRVSVGVSVDLISDPGGFTVLSAIAKQF